MSLFREIRQTLALAFPMIVGQLGGMALGIVDAAMVGRGLGTQALAALTFAINYAHVPFISAFGLVSSISVHIAQAHGEGRPERVPELLRHGLLLVMGYAVIMVVALAWAFPHLDVVNHLGQPPEILPLTAQYLPWFLASLVTTLGYASVRVSWEARNRPWLPLVVLCGTVLLNCLLNWLLIFGNWGFPRMELEGAALATFLSSLTGLLVLLVLTARKGALPGGLQTIFWGPWVGITMRSLLRIGGHTYLQIFGEVGAFTGAALMMGWLGAAPLAAHHIAIQLAALSFMVPLGLSFAVTIRIGQAVGRGDLAAVSRIGHGAQGFVVLWMSTIALLFLAMRGVLPGFFSQDPVVLGLAASFLTITAFFQVFDGVQVVTLGILRGQMDTRIPTITCLTGYWLVCLPLGYLLAFRLGLGGPGIWWALLIGLAFSAASQVVRFQWLLKQAKP